VHDPAEEVELLVVRERDLEEELLVQPSSGGIAATRARATRARATRARTTPYVLALENLLD
jgi:hypothetical protein